jgi:hypothetical protein
MAGAYPQVSKWSSLSAVTQGEEILKTGLLLL